MISVNLFGDPDAHVKAQVLGGDTSPRFITFDVGPLGVILASAAQARALAVALTAAADQLDAANVAEPVAVAPEPEIPF